MQSLTLEHIVQMLNDLSKVISKQAVSFQIYKDGSYRIKSSDNQILMKGGYVGFPNTPSGPINHEQIVKQFQFVLTNGGVG